jgi:ATP-binding cassette, subfamily B, bacterial
LKPIIKAVNFIAKVKPLTFVLIILIKVIQGLFPIISLVILQKLINSVQLYFESNLDISVVFQLLFLQIGFTILNNIISKLDRYLKTVMQLKVELELKTIISKKVLHVPYEKLEDHEFYNLLQRTQGDVGSQFLGPVNNILEFITIAITIAGILSFLLQFSVIFIVILILSSFPLFLVQNKFGKDRYILTKFLTPNAREQNYIFGLFTDRKYNKEIRMNQSFNYLFKKWKFAYAKNSNEVLKQQLNQSKILLGFEMISSATFAICFFLLIYLLSNSRIRIGDFVSIVEAIQRILGSISGLSYITSSIMESNFYLNDIFTLIEIEFNNNRVTELKEYKPRNDFAVEIKNLNFKYPFTKSYAIRNINLAIKKGSTTMIVGSNGSGKSTLIKCIIGLYRNPPNTIKLFGKDIETLSEEEIYKKISIIFQDFGTYELTAFENILLGDIHNNQFNVVKAAKYADIHYDISSLKYGYRTRLGRLFEESKDLSGGQWQKLALSRAILKDSELIIFDEPTSSLDPIAEKNLFLNFKNITKEKTSIYISHRMYACHLADRIIVLKNGEIVEDGTHNELLRLNGHYAELYTNQSEMYLNPKKEVYHDFT